MMNGTWGILALAVFFGPTAGWADSLDNNSYVQIYQDWLKNDQSALTKFQNTETAVTNTYNAEAAAEAGYPGTLTPQYLEDFRLKALLAHKNTARQEIKVDESTLRLSIIRSMVATGLTDIPLCPHPGPDADYSFYRSLALNLLRDASPSDPELEDNAYVRLYEKWVDLEKNSLDRLQTISDLRQNELASANAINAIVAGSITQTEVGELQAALDDSKIDLQQQATKISEAEARAELLRQRVAAGLTDNPICVRPDDVEMYYQGILYP